MPELLDPPYMQRALAVGLVIAVPLALVGTWVVLRGLAFFSHAVAVATFPGVVVGLGIPALGPFAGSLIAAGALSGAVGWMERDHRVRGGAVTGLALSTAMALGAVLLTSVFPGSAQVESVLFGSLLGVGDADVARAAVVALIGTAGVLALGPRLAAATFDREWAAQAGGAPGRGDVVLLALVALVVVAALPAVGSLLVGGLLVLPAAAARLLTGRVGPMLAVATGLSLVEVAAGLALARLLDVSPGASIAAVGGVGVAIAAGADVLRRRLLVARARPA